MLSLPYNWRLAIVKAAKWAWDYFGTHFIAALATVLVVKEADLQ